MRAAIALTLALLATATPASAADKPWHSRGDHTRQVTFRTEWGFFYNLGRVKPCRFSQLWRQGVIGDEPHSNTIEYMWGDVWAINHGCEKRKH